MCEENKNGLYSFIKSKDLILAAARMGEDCVQHNLAILKKTEQPMASELCDFFINYISIIEEEDTPSNFFVIIGKIFTESFNNLMKEKEWIYKLIYKSMQNEQIYFVQLFYRAYVQLGDVNDHKEKQILNDCIVSGTSKEIIQYFLYQFGNKSVRCYHDLMFLKCEASRNGVKVMKHLLEIYEEEVLKEFKDLHS